MWGCPRHMAALKAAIAAKYSSPAEQEEELDILVAERIKDRWTYDGIDWNGERVADEVLERVESLESSNKKVVKLSITGYSLGGMIARYMIGILQKKGFFDNVEPVNFCTFATPHLGLLKYPTVISWFVNCVGSRLLSKTGEQFFCQDRYDGGRPLIEVMADPNDIFYQGLAQFKHMRLYANAINDVTVPYCTSAIEIRDVFAEYVCNGLEITKLEIYPYVLEKFTLPDSAPPKPAPWTSEWFDRIRPIPLLPPTVHLKFPYNLVVYSLLPLLAVPALLYLVSYCTLHNHRSRARVEKLESDATFRERLAAAYRSMEQEIERVSLPVDEETNEQLPVIKIKLHPVVTPLQKRMAKSLNNLPWKKECAFFPWVRNSHAMIVGRDANIFPQHKKGESVVKHWADHFNL
ncbi:hypothetical protein AGABI2DRAFT_70587 [Agaricus bisporus var. bisporus H97]|uniref:hypothetical protein n=1 Tax=Agaricus bisporus var. bisporus (strain H97 / ATCC MYA-4626 / FGSC 10389) TaxID=936046 RepID=UPI00029F6556|nr:hypothetical protein AGABI2DRAFT_70587 [Agaricus bisporus var. bisporus H97]EKV46520.1 hypothetical protein AGABI2DRAFT_70587 [Agaricus bisporus var. bisporus H97]